ncbi:group II intron maturase-specific domain-containing protein [Rhizobium sp. 18065]|uniref:group II intron maturase-specific domain-containing protein n=1 Tax=Rhizobium sp. 18065 TaxID=2681411 RepID=UPI0032AFB6B8
MRAPKVACFCSAAWPVFTPPLTMRATIKSLNIPRQTPGTLAEIAKQLDPLFRGWIAYYGRYSRSALSTLAD